MRALIIEDEHAAVENLSFLLNRLAPEVTVVAVIDTVAEAVDYLKTAQDFDLAFMDIHLADGNSFEIFKQVEVKAPTIFITAFDQYAIRAFKINSIDYLLKPIQKAELANALRQFRQQQISPIETTNANLQSILAGLQAEGPQHRQSFLVRKGELLIPVATKDFAFFFIQNGVVRGTTNDQVTYHLDEKLEDVEKEVDGNDFFRVNRQFLVQRASIKHLSFYFNGRLLVNTIPEAKEQIVVSKANAPRLKKWLN